MRNIAIIGGGPAGSMAAEALARGGWAPTVYEPKPEREKPCGGGLTSKMLARYPFLLAAGVPVRCVHEIELMASGGVTAHFTLPKPVAIYARSTLNQLLFARAQQAGARTVADSVIDIEPNGKGWRLRGRRGDYRCDYLILATGAGSRLRRRLTSDFTPSDYLLTYGYYVPGHEDVLRVRFFENFEGYAWAFPRHDHISVGIGGRCGCCSMAELRARLHHFMEECGYRERGAAVFSHLLPSLRAGSWGRLELAGPDWVAVGDAGGLVDPVTGEGIGYAMWSGELVAQSLQCPERGSYAERVWNEFGRAMAQEALLLPHFYRGSASGGSIPTLIVRLAARAARLQSLVADLVAYWPFVENVGLRVCGSLAASVGGTVRESVRDILRTARGLGSQPEPMAVVRAPFTASAGPPDEQRRTLSRQSVS